MADLSVTPVGTQVKPMPGMSLADMVDIARGAQKYQAERIALTLEQQKEAEREKLQRFFSDPANFQKEGRIDINKLNDEIPRIAPLTGGEIVRQYTDLNKAQTAAIEASQKLTQDQRSMIASRIGIIGRAGVTDKLVYQKELEQLKQENPKNSDFIKLIDSYQNILSELQSGPELPKIAIQGANSLLTPQQQNTAFAPEISVDAQGRTVIKKPSVGTEPPTISYGIAGGVQAGTDVLTPAPETKAGPSKGAGMMLPYPVRSASQKYIPEPSEEKDAQAGIDYRTNLVNRQVSLPTDRRNAEEAISKAKQILEDLKFKGGGVAGTIESKLRMAISNTDYAALAKDLANLQISNSKTLGVAGNTVAGLDLTKVASGDISVPPKVLIEIARRAQADMTNIDMQAQGAQQFKLRFGDNNMKAFQQAWNANADTKVFQAMNIYKEIADPEQRKQAIDKLLDSDSEFKKIADPIKREEARKKARQEYYNKYNNIKQLTATGGL